MVMNIVSSHWTLLELVQFFWPKILFSVLCGGIVGLERELKSKPAGIKTNILICVGAALYTSVSILLSSSYAQNGYYGDPARIAAQIVSGIGFLGGGAIIQSRGSVQGLTTAATIWVVAAIGICVGIGHPDIAILSSVTVVLVLVAIGYFEDRVLGRSIPFQCEILADDLSGSLRAMIQQALSRNDLVLEDFDVRRSGNEHAMFIKYNGNRNNNKKFLIELWGTPGVKEVRHV
ncbi:MAG: MgtC/SapB family protein [Deltaproteobacteria bacterium]|nr:MgtC/SapB family protein [Deltaproteobacteria bacterium]